MGWKTLIKHAQRNVAAYYYYYYSYSRYYYYHYDYYDYYYYYSPSPAIEFLRPPSGYKILHLLFLRLSATIIIATYHDYDYHYYHYYHYYLLPLTTTYYLSQPLLLLLPLPL